MRNCGDKTKEKNREHYPVGPNSSTMSAGDRVCLTAKSDWGEALQGLPHSLVQQCSFRENYYHAVVRVLVSALASHLPRPRRAGEGQSEDRETPREGWPKQMERGSRPSSSPRSAWRRSAHSHAARRVVTMGASSEGRDARACCPAWPHVPRRCTSYSAP
eukprot:COSAG03_NODE_2780_length_2456_cov_2.935936_1_plen_160_part_00